MTKHLAFGLLQKTSMPFKLAERDNTYERESKINVLTLSLVVMTMIEGLTKSQVENLIEFIEFNFIDDIRRNTDIDNIDYVIDMMDALVKLRKTYKAMKNKEDANGNQAKP